MNNINETENVYQGVTLSEMFESVKSEPKKKYIYSGISENSVGFIYGPSKSGKTIFLENLAMCISSGAPYFLEDEIGISKSKVLFISLEEGYLAQSQRNFKQATKWKERYGKSWAENYIVPEKDFPRYISTKEDWKMLKDLILNVEPKVTIIDSLNNLYVGSIEESKVAKVVTKNLKELAEETKTTLIVIHHTPKLYGKPLSRDTLAGSRVLVQEADFLIGINKTTDNRRYVKEVCFRYRPDDNENVKLFSITDDCLIKLEGYDTEINILMGSDGRRNDQIRDSIFEFMNKLSTSPEAVIPFKELSAKYVTTQIMTSVTLNDHLNKLIQDGKIKRLVKGKYIIVKNNRPESEDA